VTLTPQRLLVPWSRKNRATPLFPVWAVRPVQILSACTRVHFTFTFTLTKPVISVAETESERFTMCSVSSGTGMKPFFHYAYCECDYFEAADHSKRKQNVHIIDYCQG